jgi:hypothetical protein
VQPIAEAAGEASRQVNWLVVLAVVLGIFGVWLYPRFRRKRKTVGSPK